MKVGDLVRLKSSVEFPVDLYSRWASEGTILSEVGEMNFNHIGIVLDLKDLKNRPIIGAKVIIDGITGWTYQEFLEVVNSDICLP